ncbi:efflux RND transporter permease subunit [Flagellimonas sp.]|uniref:efflux RND transporter permease subunit n=1 Tax=Flagellimonas sp. TaxID=2058762 RepID=UPI003B50C8F4
MTTLAIFILGLLSSIRVPISLLPDIDIPEISVQIDGNNMSARELENTIIRPLRLSLLQISNLDEIKSETTNGSGVIRLRFFYGTSINYSFIEVNEKVDRMMVNLSRDIKRPRVIKAKANDLPVLYINLTLPKTLAVKKNGSLAQQFLDFNRFANLVVRKRIEQLPEVAMVDVTGVIKTEIIVVPDRQKLTSFGLGLEEIESAIKKANLEIGSISVRDGQYQYNLRFSNELSNIKSIENIYVSNGSRILQLKNLASIKELPQSRKGLTLYNGKEAYTMAIIKKKDARMYQLKGALEKTIEQIKEEHSEIEFSITRDQTKLLDYSIRNLGKSLFWGILLAFSIMFLFLRDIKSPFLIGIGIPVSLIICLFVFDLFEISINIISLSGLILGVGLMIDNSIIIIDNITQFRERGLTLEFACIDGTNEVFRPLLSSVLTTCAVFIPLIFLSGIAGTLFFDQAMAITIGLFTSLLVSVTLLPVLYYLFHSRKGKFHQLGKSMIKWDTISLEKLYKKVFKIVMTKQKWAFGIFGLLIFLGGVLFIMIPKEQMPRLSSTETIMSIDWNESINAIENKKRIISLLGKIEDTLIQYSALVGQQQFLLDKNGGIKTSDSKTYLQTSNENNLEGIKISLNRHIKQRFPKAIVNFTEVDNLFNLIFSDESPPLTVKIQNLSNDFNRLNEDLLSIWKKIEKSFPYIDIQPIQWENIILLTADSKKLLLYGIEPKTFENTLKSAFSKKEILFLRDNQDFVPVVLGSEKKSISQVLQSTKIMSIDGTYYDVGDFIQKNYIQDLGTIIGGKEGEYYPIDFFISRNKEKEVKSVIKKIIDGYPNYDVQYTGSIDNNEELIMELLVIILVTLVLLYFILASQFESLTLPLIILLEVPISFAGALLFLIIFGMSINLMSMIGIVVMTGIIINDSILKIDAVIQQKRKGNSILRSLIIAGQRRLKPILMTSLTTILALIPVLVTDGLGGELQAPLAVALIGGLLMGTFVSLYFIPLCYYHLVKRKNHSI